MLQQCICEGSTYAAVHAAAVALSDQQTILPHAAPFLLGWPACQPDFNHDLVTAIDILCWFMGSHAWQHHGVLCHLHCLHWG